MRSRFISKGFTLIEVLFVTALFSLVVLLTFQALNSAMPAQRKLRTQVERLRDGATTLSKLQRELRTTALIHWPTGAWVDYTPNLAPGNGPLMFVKNAAPAGWSSGDVVAYWHDPERKIISRAAYVGSGFVFGEISTYIPLPDESLTGRILAREVESFTLRQEHSGEAGFLAVEIVVEGVREPLTARVRRLPSPGL